MVRSDIAGSDSRVEKPTERIISLTASRDAATVQRVIREKYGFEPSLNYCIDLILFVEALTDGQQ